MDPIAEAVAISSKYHADEIAFHNEVERWAADREKSSILFPSRAQGDAGAKIVLLDHMVSVMELDCCDVDIWIEDELHVNWHFTPPNRTLEFKEFELAGRQIDKVMAQFFGNTPGITATGEFYGIRLGPQHRNVSRKSDPTDRGRDLFHITMVGLAKRPGAAKAAVLAAKKWNNILAHRDEPYPGD